VRFCAADQRNDHTGAACFHRPAYLQASPHILAAIRLEPNPSLATGTARHAENRREAISLRVRV
jgi:hypothetical protein